MPNGGSDCCGTCWFNSANDGAAKYMDSDYQGEVRCTIRDATIRSPFWTYCVNHPHHCPERIDQPIGPLYVDRGEVPYGREVLIESPDTEAVRTNLLDLLANMQEVPADEYPTSPKLDEAVIQQLGEFREPRAGAGLRRVVAFNPLATPAGDNPFDRNRVLTVAYAIEALARILQDDALAEITEGHTAGREDALRLSPYDADKDELVTIRYYSVKAMCELSSDNANPLLRSALSDPNENVVTLAREMIK